VDQRRTALTANETGMNAPERKRSWLALLLALPTAVFLALFYFYPLAKIIQVSLARAEGGAAAAIMAVLGSPTYLKIIGFTFYQAGLSTLLTLLTGMLGLGGLRTVEKLSGVATK